MFTASLLAVSVCGAAHAQNATGNGFQTGSRGGWQEYAYHYTNRTGEPQRLFFRLSADDIARGGAEFQDWNNEGAKQAGVQAAQQKATEWQTEVMQIAVAPETNGMSINIRTPKTQQYAQQAEKVRDQLTQTYYVGQEAYAKRNYYKMTKLDGVKFIQPDHPAIAVRYTKAMGPVAKAILEQVPGANENPRAFINAALTWLQSIPYDTLQNRATSNGAGFQTPYGLIGNNLGDCDTKATALAALIRAVYPTIPLAIVYVPEHAFLGIGLPQTKEDFALRTEQGTFILADATGPSLSPLGYIDPRTQAKTGGARTSILLVP